MPIESPDGRYVYFVRNTEGKFRLWRIRPDGSGEGMVDGMPPLISPGSEWWPVQLSIYFYGNGAGKPDTVADRIAQQVVKARLEPLERYGDDVIAHGSTERQAQEMRKAIAARLQSCGLELHSEKTKIVYCKDDSRKKTYPNERFDFLGYAFRPRSSMTRKGKFFLNFSPPVSNKAAKAMRDKFRSWKLPPRSDQAIEDLSPMFNPIIRGWIQYCGRFARRFTRRCAN